MRTTTKLLTVTAVAAGLLAAAPAALTTNPRLRSESSVALFDAQEKPLWSAP